MLAILSTVMLWGLSYSSTKYLLESLQAIQIAFYRLIFAVVVLGVSFIAARKGALKRSDIPRVIIGGAFGTFLYFLFENNGLRFTTAGTGSLIIATIPVLNVMAGSLFFKEKTTPLRWLGVILSFAGVYLIIRSGSTAAFSLANMRGNLLVFGAACSWVFYTRINEPLMQKYDSITINLYQSVVGLVLLGMLAAPSGLNPAAIGRPVLFNLAYLGIFCSAVAYFLYLYALKSLGAATITTFINLIPVVGVLGGAVILKEAIVAGQLIGGVVVISGVTLVTRSEIAKQPDYSLDASSA